MKRDKERLVTNDDELALTLKKITYGFYIVTSVKNGQELQTREEDYLAAGLVSWVSQCSFDPPMIMMAIQKQSNLAETIRKSRVFAVNILGKADVKMIPPFSKNSQVEENKINGYLFKKGTTGCPVFESVPAYLECHLEEVVESQSDHVVLVGKVVNHHLENPDAEPLMEWETNYHYGG